jgi:hypothetical protein
MATLLMASMFVLESHYAQILPRTPEERTGRIYPLNVHGIVYATRAERQ